MYKNKIFRVHCILKCPLNFFCTFIILFFAILIPTFAFALPHGQKIIYGEGHIQKPDNSNIVIYQNSDQMITNWQEFNIGQSESVKFMQPNTDSVALNRVIGHDPTSIFGKISANGQIFLSNPSGIYFGPNSVVNVGGLMATTLNISNKDFLERNYNFKADISKPFGSVVNEGRINATNYIGLLGTRSENIGLLSANLGSIVLGSSEAATVDFGGDGLIKFVVTKPVAEDFLDLNGKTIKNGVFNSGQIQADGGKVLLTARMAQKMVRSVVNNTGIIRAQSVNKRNGSIYLEGGPNSIVTNENILDASGLDSGETGGTVHVLGEKVGLFGNANINVSGFNGGGTILIGGDYRGQGKVLNSQVSNVGKNVFLNSRAIHSGNGGKTIVWSDDTTRFFGNIDSRGGSTSGNGGFVEISGKNYLSFIGKVDTTSENGLTGNLLLDPGSITIANGSGADSLSGGTLTTSSGTSTIFEQNLESVAATTNIALEAGTSITFSDLDDDLLDLKQTSGNSVSFITTDNSGTISFSDIFDEVRTQGGNITFSSTNGSVSTGKLNSSGGTISLNGANGVTINGNIRTGGGNFTVDADSDNDASGVYTQGVNKTVRVGTGSVNITASDINLLSGSANISGSSTNYKSIHTGHDFTAGGSVTFNQSAAGKTIGIGESVSSNFNIDQNELTSITTPTFLIGDADTSGAINIDNADFGNKNTTITSGAGIELSGSKIIFRKKLTFNAKTNVNITNGSNIEAHISGRNANFSVTADSDQIDGGSLSIDSSSSITTQGGNIDLIGNSINNSGTLTTNGGTSTTTIRSTSLSSNEESSSSSNNAASSSSASSGSVVSSSIDFSNPKNQALLDLFTIEEAVTVANQRDQAIQTTVLSDFLENGGYRGGC
jgi:filamentous hemagglutinin family protein